MKKTLFLTSFAALTFAVPAIAEPSHSSNSFPSNGVMEEDYTYVGQANVTNLKVSSGTATTSASYTDCPSGYPNSDDGATSTDQCYKMCTVSDFPANSHIATVTGKNYQGANETDTCAIESCDTGYTLNPGNPDLTTIVGEGVISGYGYKSISGANQNSNESTYNITQNGEFVWNFGDLGQIRGEARCSTYYGTSTGNYGITRSDLPDDGGGMCWCKFNSYTPSGGEKQDLESSWIFVNAYSNSGTGPQGCADFCAEDCGSDSKKSAIQNHINDMVPPSAPSCQANTITITWDGADAADVTANNAGSVTYGGDIRTPRKAQHVAGKVFTGWTFNTPSGN